METLQFKTNINCGGCVAKVTSKLNEVVGINTWKVNTENAHKVLTVEAEAVSAGEIVAAVKNAGFKIEQLA